MKTAVAAIFALAGAATVAAVDFPDNMPECGRICGTNMLEKADEFGCDDDDIACLCRDVRFGYGIHDCSVEACSELDNANTVISWGNNLCSNAGAPANIPTATALDSGNPVVTSEVVATITDATVTTTAVTTIADGDNGDNGDDNGDVSAVTTSAWTSVLTSVITGEETLSGISGVPGATSLPETTITEPIVETQTQETTTFETTVGTSTFVSSLTGDALTSALTEQATDTATETETDGATETTETASGVRVTAGPVIGFVAAAGIAVALL